MNSTGIQQNEGDEEEDGDIVFQAVQYDNADFLAELLSENRELVGAMDGNGRTSLHFAAFGGHSKCAELLIQAGADIDAVSGIPDSLRTPLEMSAANGRAEILRLLIENGADLFYNDSDGHSALLLAQMNGHQQCAHILISAIEKVHYEAKMKNQQLCSACIDGNLSEMLGILADLGHKNVRNEILNGPAESEQKSALYLAAENGRAELVNELLNISGHLIIFEPTGDTILHAAIASKDIETVKIILQKFPFLMDASNQEKNLPIHWACRCGNPLIVQFLLEYSNYPPEEMKFFEFPHENQRNGTSRKLGHLFPCDLNAPDQEGRSPLYLAVMEGNAKIVEFLSKFKLPAFDGSNPIGMKTMQNSMEERSPFVFDTYVNGRTPLMVACTNGSVEIVRFLLESGHVDVNLPIALTEAETNSAVEAHCLDGSGALIEATKRGNLAIIRLLFRHGAFDYGNRALAEIIMEEKEQQNGGNDEIIGLFLEHLAFSDIERKIILPSSKNWEKISKATGNLLAFQNSSGQMASIKACQLNWAATGIMELKLEWLMAAANRMNPQLTSRQQIKHFPLCAITRIDISANKLKSIPAFFFAQLPSLFLLDCSKNSICRLEMPPEAADWKCPQLELLIVEQNQLEELPNQLFSGQHFPRLRQFTANANRLRRVPASIWTAPRLAELNLANNELNELNSIIMDLRRTSHSQLYRQGGTAAARISRHQREKKEEKEKSAGGIMFNKMEPEERQSRSTTKRESPHQKSAGNSRQCSNEKQNERGIGGRKASSATESEGNENGIVEKDILRTNIWQKRIQLSNIDDNTENKDDQQEMGNITVEKGGNENNNQIGNSPIQILNLAGNKFTRMPTCLACCCPRLNRLDFSRNLLTNLGPIECLPSALRHLDFSSNKLSRCFVEFPTQLKQKLRNCEAQNSFVGIQNVGVIQGNSIARHSRSRSKSVARNQRSLSVVRQSNGGPGKNVDGTNISDNFCCLHKSHCRLEALKTLNLSNNLLNSLELLLTPLMANESEKPMNSAELSILLAKIVEQRQFDWKEGGEHLKPYLLFPSLTSLDISGNRLTQIPQIISLHNSLAILNLANNFELECLPPELGLLDKLWNIGLNGCSLRGETQQIRQFVEAGNYKTAEVLSHLRQRLENSIVYPKVKLMFLGGSAVGKTTLLHQMRLEGTVPKKSLQNESWSRRMGHSPVKGIPLYSSPSHNRQMGRSNSQQRISQSNSLYPVEVAEWTYEPKRSSSKSTPSSSIETLKGPITFRTWDFDGIKQKEQLSIEICFLTRRCLYLLLWKVTDGEIALDELQEWLIAIQERAPNSSVLIIGTHSDFVREQSHRFPKDYLTKLDQQIQSRFIVGIDPEKRGLPRVLGSLYLSCRSREDVKSLCSLIYTCAGHIGTGRSGSKLKLTEKVPSSFVALERVVVNMTDEMRENRQEPILHFQEFWTLASERLLLDASGKPPMQFRDIQDFRQACLFLHENGILCYFDDTFLRDYIFLDPPWLCSILRGILAFAANQRLSNTSESSPSSLHSSPQSNFLQIHQNSLADSTELFAVIKQSFKQHLLLSNSFFNPSSNSSEHSSLSNKYFRLFRQCGISLLRKFELALPFQNGKLSLLASFLPDEYLLRADYPGSKVRTRTKFDKLKLRWAKIDRPKSFLAENSGIGQQSMISASPIRNYLEHRRLSRTIAPVNIENNGSEMAARKSEENGNAQFSKDYFAEINDWVKILGIEQSKEQFLRRLYVMHYLPQGFWPRIITRLLDDERLGDALSKLLLLSKANEPAEMKATEEDGATFRIDSIAMALAKALNSGRVFNLAQQQNSMRRHQNDQKNKMEEEEDESETSFIVLNPAEEVTEESIESANNGPMPASTMMIRCCEKGMEASDDDGGEMIGNGVLEGENGIEWLLWKTGVEIRTLGTFLLSFRQFLPLASVQDLNYSTHQLFRRFEDGQWRPLTTPNEEGHQQGLGHMVELLVPQVKIRLKWRDAFWELRTDRRVATKVLVLVSSIFDDLLEDWYPQLGTRFVLSSQGLLLVDRLIPCDRCSIDAIQEEERYWLRENINRNPAASADFIPSRPTRSISTKFNHKNDAKRLPKSKSSSTTPLSSGITKNQPIDGIDLNQQKPILAINPSPVYLFSMEECILEARKALNSLEEIVDERGKNVDGRLECPRHGLIGLVAQIEGRNENGKNGPDLGRMCPDLLFTDLLDEWLFPSESIRRGKMLGRGAFGFVFTGTISGQFRRKTNSIEMAALKILEPVEQNASSIHQLGESAQMAFRAFGMKWQNDLMEQATRAYCTARQEICMLSELAHPNCTQMLAFCAKPMTLLLELAPTGSLDKILTEFRRCGQRLHMESLQRASLQIAKALEYLHVNQHIIYRDLKSENVLVWRFPSPNTPGRQKSLPPTDVLLKLGDYGISRFSYPSGVCKGYGGTEGFMAPEIMRYNGEQEYTERVDCFSFGMFLYELVTLRQPYEGFQMQQMKERILEAQRPNVTEKELLHPTNVLDLMVACWEERAELRPSSSQLVGICSAPEYMHLLDMALLKDGERTNAPNSALGIIQQLAGIGGIQENEQHWICWIPCQNSREDGGKSQSNIISLLQCSPFGWTEKKLLKLPNAYSQSSPMKRHQFIPKITAIAQIYDEFLWFGDEAGNLTIFEIEKEGGASPLIEEELFCIDLIRTLENCPKQIAQFQRNADEEMATHELLKRTTPIADIQSEFGPHFAILQIDTFPERKIIIIALCSAILLCRWQDREQSPQFITNIQLDSECRLFSMAILPSLGDWQIWTGHSNGRIFIHHISSTNNKLAFSTSVNHFGAKKMAQKVSSVFFLIASKCIRNLLWSVMENDSLLFMWRDSQLQKMLNCAKILPVSESLSSIEGPEEIANNSHFITALELIDLGSTEEGDEQLLAGTSRGILLIIRAIDLQPISSFRPYFGAIHGIFGCPPNSRFRPSTSRILQNELLLSATNNLTLSSPSIQMPQIKSTKKRSTVMEKSRSIMLKAAGLQTSLEGKHPMERQKSLDNPAMTVGHSTSSFAISDVRNEVRSAVDEFCDAVKSGMRDIFVGNEMSETKCPEENISDTFFVTIGAEYRPLLNRFIGNMPETKDEIEKENCAIFWRATNHWCTQQNK